MEGSETNLKTTYDGRQLMMEDDMFRLFPLPKIFICEGNQQLKRSGANGFQTGKDMSSFLLDKPSVGDTIDSRQLSTGVTVTGVQHSKD